MRKRSYNLVCCLGRLTLLSKKVILRFETNLDARSFSYKNWKGFCVTLAALAALLPWRPCCPGGLADIMNIFKMKWTVLNYKMLLKRVSVRTTASNCKPTTQATSALLFRSTWPASSICKPTTFFVTEGGLCYRKYNCHCQTHRIMFYHKVFD